MAKVQHLMKRGGRYYFRCRVPDDLIAHLGKEHLQHSLKTTDRKQAIERVNLERVWVNQNSPLNHFLSCHLPKGEWSRYLGNILFVLESQKVNLHLTYAGCHQPVQDTLEAELVTETFPKPCWMSQPH